MDPLIVQQLTALLQADSGLFRVSALKHEAKDFSYKELRQEVARRQFFQPLHEFAQQFLTTAGISNESGKYYASLVKFYTTYKLQRMKKETAQLYLLFFAFHRFRQINDNLIEALIHWVDQYEKQAKRAAEEAMNNAVASASKNLQAAGHVLSLFTDDQITESLMTRLFHPSRKKRLRYLTPNNFRWSLIIYAILRSTRLHLNGRITQNYRRPLNAIFDSCSLIWILLDG